ncbi:MAG TPA: O-antigen ligase family protein [Ramlibacter sp.]|nr:O-antigen ligase family protein [Ramlibacter sp.]
MTARPAGYLHWVLPAMLGLGALTVLLSGRDLSMVFVELQSGEVFSNPVITWGQRALSLLVIGVCAERVLSHVSLRRPMPAPLLTWAFVVFWIGTVALPAFFGANPRISHEFLYPLIIGIAFLLATEAERDHVVEAVRNALFLFILASVILIPINPTMVLDMKYSQGLIPGMPRLGGLAPHPVAMGMFVQTFLVCLWCRPYSRRWLNGLAWVIGLGVLFFAQSKTAWFAFVLCSIALVAVRSGPGMGKRLADPRQSAFGIVLCLGVIAVVGAVMGVLLLGNLEAQASTFLDSAEGAQLVTLTGRDQIWAVALEVWREHPLFGYGPALWDDAFRASIGMPQATHGHNEFIDTLARSGVIGAATLVFYSVVLLVLSFRYARATGGLSLALFLSLALRFISEVPMLMFGYGPDLLVALLIVITLASAAEGARRRAAPIANARTSYRVAS